MSDAENQITLTDKERWEIKLEDWKMAKDRIKSFNTLIVTIRISGIPIVLIIMSIGFAIVDEAITNQIPMIHCNVAALPFIIAAVYIIPLFLLDKIYFQLLLDAVQHAKEIEESPPFKDVLGITRRLTSKKMERIHRRVMVAIYVAIFLLAIGLAFSFWNGANVDLQNSSNIFSTSRFL